METLTFASEHLSSLLNRLGFQVKAALTRRDTDAIHDLRVAIRRFSQGLVVFKPCFASKRPKKIRRSLKKTLAVAGQVRDCDIAIQLLSKLNTPETSGLRTKLNLRRGTCSAKLQETLKPWVSRRMSAKWRRELESARLLEGSSRRSIEETARAILPRDAKNFFECGERAARPKAPAEELHRFRVAAKKFRYSLELFASLYPASEQGWFEQLKKTQQLLGSVNDCRTVRSVVSELAPNNRVEATLKKRQDRKMAEFRRFWRQEFSQTSTSRQWIAHLRRPTGPSLPARKTVTRSRRPGPTVLAAGA